MVGIIIRQARREDCKEIRNLIQGMADYYNMPEAPKIDAETLERDGFGDNPWFYGFVAEESGKLLGYTLYSFQYLSFTGRALYMGDLYVIPGARNKGVGTLLFETIAKKAVEENCTVLNFATSTSVTAADFYKKRGAVDVSEMRKWEGYRVFRVFEESLKKLSESKNSEA